MNIVVFKDQRDFLGKRLIAFSPSCLHGNDEMRQVNAKNSFTIALNIIELF